MEQRKEKKNQKALIVGIFSFVLLFFIIAGVNQMIDDPAMRLCISSGISLIWFAGILTVPCFHKGDFRECLHDHKNTAFLILYIVLIFLIMICAGKSLSDSLLKTEVIVLTVTLGIAGVLVGAGISRKRIGLTRAYVILAAVLGICFDLAMPVGMVPDEWAHLDTAYLLSSEMLGLDEAKNPNDILMRKDDSQFEIMQTDVSVEDYKKYLTSSGDTLKNEQIVSTKSKALNGNEYLYVLPACGITLGRIFHLNSFDTLNLGRLFNLIFCIAITAVAVEVIPCGKWILIVTALMPTSLQQNMSCSYDVPVNAFSFLIIAVSVRSAMDEKYRPELFTGILSAMGIFVLLMAKSHAYFLLGFLPVFVLIERKLHISQERKDRVMIRIVIFILVLLSLTLLFFFSGMALRVIPESHRMVSWEKGKEGYTLWYFARNPQQLLILPLQTIRWQLSTYFTSYFGKWMGWFEINTGNMASLVFAVLLILAVISEDKKISRTNISILFWLTGIGVILCVFGGFLFAYSTVSKPYIEGVQGRYLIPAVTLILIAIAGRIREKVNVCDSIYIFGSCSVALWTLTQILLWYVSVH